MLALSNDCIQSRDNLSGLVGLIFLSEMDRSTGYWRGLNPQEFVEMKGVKELAVSRRNATEGNERQYSLTFGRPPVIV